MGPSALLDTLLKNVLYIEFNPRHPHSWTNQPRRMICSNSDMLLDSVEGKMILNWHRPKNVPKFKPVEKDLVVTWDILWQDFRMIPADAVVITRQIPIEEFMPIFYKEIYPMSQKQKVEFMYF